MEKIWKSDQEIIGDKIKAVRKTNHLTQEGLAEKIGGCCTGKVISRYENGDVEMGIQTLIDVAESLEVPVDTLLPERVKAHKTDSEADELENIFMGLNIENRQMLLNLARMMKQNEGMKMAM